MEFEIKYKNKKTKREILENTREAIFDSRSIDFLKSNLLIIGDNLEVMKFLLDTVKMQGFIDLVYIDPPFSTYNIFRHSKDRTSTVSSSYNDDTAYMDTLKGTEFLEFLRERLIFIRELMSDQSSIYLHIDYKIGYYVKIIMDEIFGHKNFRNDITRIKCKPKNFARKGYGNIKDLILFYTKSDNFIWNEPSSQFSEKDLERLFPKKDRNGRRYTTTPLHAPGETKNGNTGKPWKEITPPRGRHWRYDPSELDELDRKGLIEWSTTGNPRKIIYADEAEAKGKRLQDIWEFRDPQYPIYPTKKNIELLKTIIKTSSNPGQVVFDCFCGSGGTLIAAHELERRWIGINNSEAAIKTVKKRFKEIQEKEEGSLFSNILTYKFLKQRTKV